LLPILQGLQQGLPTKLEQHNKNVLESKVLDIQEQLKALQLRIVGDGVQIGTHVFQSFDDVQTWVIKELPNRRYGLFVDAVSLLDFFTSIGHVEAEKTFSSFYNQHKTGFVSMYEAQIVASVQKLFPMVFGKSESTGLNASESLPATTNPNKWDKGATGLQYQISRSMGDVEYQLESTIDSVLVDFLQIIKVKKARSTIYMQKNAFKHVAMFQQKNNQI
jgi:hypothetical protein